MKKLMIQLQNNTLEETTITLAGLQLGKQRTAILSKSLQVNENLHTLHMARKGMQDEEGEDFINRIKRNKYLENIELEGRVANVAAGALRATEAASSAEASAVAI